MNKNNIIVFATNFPPQVGGVANYSFNLAKSLMNIGALNYVLTSKFQEEPLDMDIVAPKFIRNESLLDSFLMFRKMRSLFFSLNLSLFLIWQVIKIKLFHRTQTVIITSFYTLIDLRILSLFILLRINYTPVFHGLDILSLSTRKTFLDKILKNACDVIVISDFTKSLLKEASSTYSIDQPPFYPPFDKSYYEAIPILHIESLQQSLSIELQGKQIIMTTCRLIQRKGVDIAIKAFSRSTISQENTVFLIVGDGPEFSNLQDLIEEEKADNIFLLGSCDDQIKFSLLSHSEVFVMPNHSNGQTDAEGFGISFVEASYFNNLVIGGKSGGAKEAIKDGYSGYLIDFDSIESVDELTDFFNSITPEIIAKFSMNAKKYVEEKFELLIMQRQLEQMVNKY